MSKRLVSEVSICGSIYGNTAIILANKGSGDKAACFCKTIKGHLHHGIPVFVNFRRPFLCLFCELDVDFFFVLKQSMLGQSLRWLIVFIVSVFLIK